MHGRLDGDGVQTADEDDEESRGQGAVDAEGEGDAGGGGNALGGFQRGEGLDGERGVGRGAGFDESGGERVDGIEAERGAVGAGRGDFAEVEALNGGVEGFGDEDGTGDAEVGFASDEAGATEVGGGTDAFEHGGEGDEGFGVGVGEAVGAGCDGFRSSGREGGGEEHNVLFLVVGDVLEVVVVGGAEAGVGEGLLGHLGDGAFVEDVLEMLEGEGILEDVSIGDGGLTFDWRGHGCDGEQRHGCRDSEELHACLASIRIKRRVPIYV